MADAAPPPPLEPASTGTAPAAPADTQSRRREAGLLGRVVEWFWLGDAVRALEQRGASVTARARELRRRARLAAELADRALEPREPFRHGAPDAFACELYRQAIYWSLLADADPRDGGDTFAALWERADRARLAHAAGGDARAEEIGAFLASCSFVDLAELEASEQARLARTLKVFTEEWLAQSDPGRPELEWLWVKRVVRLALLAVTVVALIVVALRVVDAMRWKNDLALGSPWIASSKYPEYGCVSPDQRCPGPYFFSTNEEDRPWVEFDLRRTTPISRVEVQNRVDCCQERASPIVIEVSTDRQRWMKVARRTGTFRSWEARFVPTPARWVRIRLESRTNLHLRRVRIAL